MTQEPNPALWADQKIQEGEDTALVRIVQLAGEGHISLGDMMAAGQGILQRRDNDSQHNKSVSSQSKKERGHHG